MKWDMVEDQQIKICAFFRTVQCESDQHENCEEVYGNTELNLQARCSCGCHLVKEIVPDSKTRARERASMGKKQTTLDVIVGGESINDQQTIT